MPATAPQNRTLRSSGTEAETETNQETVSTPVVPVHVAHSGTQMITNLIGSVNSNHMDEITANGR